MLRAEYHERNQEIYKYLGIDRDGKPFKEKSEVSDNEDMVKKNGDANEKR